MRRTRFVWLAVMALLVGLSVATAAAPADGTESSPKVDLNTAGVEELQSLPGIGPSLAKRIVEHRRAHGPFQRVEDLLEVKGIGEKTLARFRDRVTVSTPKKR